MTAKSIYSTQLEVWPLKSRDAAKCVVSERAVSRINAFNGGFPIMQRRRGIYEDCLGSSFQGTVSVDYDLLVECFGEPDFDISEKTPAFWCIAFEDGTIATVYCWKTYVIPEGLWDWNVGGFGRQAVERVSEAINAKLSQKVNGDRYYYIAEKGNYQILAREDNELVFFDFDRIGETDSGIIRFPSRSEAEAFISNDLSEPNRCHIVEVLDDGDFLQVL